MNIAEQVKKYHAGGVLISRSTYAELVEYAEKIKSERDQLVEFVADCIHYDSNGPDYFRCECCSAAVENNDGKAKPTDLVHDENCVYVLARSIQEEDSK